MCDASMQRGAEGGRVLSPQPPPRMVMASHHPTIDATRRFTSPPSNLPCPLLPPLRYIANAANLPPLPLLSDRVAAIVSPDTARKGPPTTAPAPAPAPIANQEPTLTIVTMSGADVSPDTAIPTAPIAGAASPLTIITTSNEALSPAPPVQPEGKPPVSSPLPPIRGSLGSASPSFKSGGRSTEEILHSGARSPVVRAEGKGFDTTPRSPYKREGKGAAYVVLDSGRRTPTSPKPEGKGEAPRTPTGPPADAHW